MRYLIHYYPSCLHQTSSSNPSNSSYGITKSDRRSRLFLLLHTRSHCRCHGHCDYRCHTAILPTHTAILLLTLTLTRCRICVDFQIFFRWYFFYSVVMITICGINENTIAAAIATVSASLLTALQQLPSPALEERAASTIGNIHKDSDDGLNKTITSRTIQ